METPITDNLWLFPFFLLGLIVFISFLLSRLSGWAYLATHYGAEDLPQGDKRNMRSLGLGPIQVSYSNCLTMVLTEEALYLRPIFLFKIGHKLLRIPLSDIKFSNKKGLFGFTIIGRTSKAPNIKFRFVKRDAEWIMQAQSQ